MTASVLIDVELLGDLQAALAMHAVTEGEREILRRVDRLMEMESTELDRQRLAEMTRASVERAFDEWRRRLGEAQAELDRLSVRIDEIVAGFAP